MRWVLVVHDTLLMWLEMTSSTQVEDLSLIIWLFCCCSVVPLLRDSVGVLMQRQPRSLDDTLPGCYHRVSHLRTELLCSFNSVSKCSGWKKKSSEEKERWLRDQNFLKVSQLEGVYSLHEPHFWTLCSDVYVGAVKVEVAPDADAKYILSQTHNIFTAVSKRFFLGVPNAFPTNLGFVVRFWCAKGWPMLERSVCEQQLVWLDSFLSPGWNQTVIRTDRLCRCVAGLYASP